MEAIKAIVYSEKPFHQCWTHKHQMLNFYLLKNVFSTMNKIGNVYILSRNYCFSLLILSSLFTK